MVGIISLGVYVTYKLYNYCSGEDQSTDQVSPQHTGTQDTTITPQDGTTLLLGQVHHEAMSDQE